MWSGHLSANFQKLPQNKNKNIQKNTNLRTHYGAPRGGCSWKFSPISRFIGKRSSKWPYPRKFCKFQKKTFKKIIFCENLRHPKNGILKTQAKTRRRQPRNPIFLGIFSFPEPDRPRNRLPSTRHKNWMLEPNRARDVKKQPQSQKASKKTRKFWEATIFCRKQRQHTKPLFL